MQSISADSGSAARVERQRTLVSPNVADAIFNALANTVECETKTEYALLAAASTLMAAYFTIMRHTAEWLAENVLPRGKGSAHLFPLFAALAKAAAVFEENSEFIEMKREFAARSGLNE